MTGSVGFDRFRYDFTPSESDADDPDAIRFFQEGTDKIALNAGPPDPVFRSIDLIGDMTFDDCIARVEIAGLEVVAIRSGNIVARLDDNIPEIDENFDGEADLTIAFTQDITLTSKDFLLFRRIVGCSKAIDLRNSAALPWGSLKTTSDYTAGPGRGGLRSAPPPPVAAGRAVRDPANGQVCGPSALRCRNMPWAISFLADHHTPPDRLLSAGHAKVSGACRRSHPCADPTDCSRSSRCCAPRRSP
ncbi:hypothetical protein [Actibacterium sp. 188UL27-1]|uniref:hypothetical protein n=1 Tax=Actibacterium sp. 188UL27-1 TaxID=2786961 RepID=UPI00195EEB36|nr:hypothetical protein [Actibacterium sp. 188UL27-1]MBM7067117.1 hypothetical protein [Actibacterium sp. 188UL27-1]